MRVALIGFAVSMALIVGTLAVVRRQPPKPMFLTPSDNIILSITPDGEYIRIIGQVPSDRLIVRAALTGSITLWAESLYTLQLNPVRLKLLTDEPSLWQSNSWSPDGKWLASHNTNGGFFIQVDSENPIPIQVDGDILSWSPDAQWVYYYDERLQRLHIASGDQQLISQDSPQYRHYHWRRWNDYIYYDSFVRASIFWSVDEQWMYFNTPADELIKMRPDGRERQTIHIGPYPARIVGLSLDGSWLYLSVSEGSASTALYRVHMQTGQVHPVTTFDGVVEFRGWSEDGQWAILAVDFEGKRSYFSMHSNGTGRRLLVSNAASLVDFDWHGWIYAVCENGGRSQSLVRVRPDGTEYAVLATGSMWWGVILFSPNEQWLGYIDSGNSEDDPASLYVMEPDGSNRRLVTTMPNLAATNLMWSPDSEWLLYTTEDGLHSIRRDGSNDRNLTAEHGIQWPYLWLPPIDHAWSPVGLLAVALSLNMAGIALTMVKRI